MGHSRFGLHPGKMKRFPARIPFWNWMQWGNVNEGYAGESPPACLVQIGTEGRRSDADWKRRSTQNCGPLFGHCIDMMGLCQQRGCAFLGRSSISADRDNPSSGHRNGANGAPVPPPPDFTVYFARMAASVAQMAPADSLVSAPCGDHFRFAPPYGTFAPLDEVPYSCQAVSWARLRLNRAWRRIFRLCGLWQKQICHSGMQDE